MSEAILILIALAALGAAKREEVPVKAVEEKLSKTEAQKYIDVKQVGRYTESAYETPDMNKLRLAEPAKWRASLPSYTEIRESDRDIARRGIQRGIEELKESVEKRGQGFSYISSKEELYSILNRLSTLDDLSKLEDTGVIKRKEELEDIERMKESEAANLLRPYVRGQLGVGEHDAIKVRQKYGVDKVWGLPNREFSQTELGAVKTTYTKLGYKVGDEEAAKLMRGEIGVHQLTYEGKR